MSTSDKIGRILFVVLALPVTAFLGMSLAGLSGAADGQGLAGGAIVLGYGVLLAVAGLILSLVVVRRISASMLRIVNIGLIMAIIGIAIFAWVRIEAKKKARSDADRELQAVPMRMIVSPSSAGEMGMGFFKPNVFDHPIQYVFGPPARGKTIQDLSPRDSIVFGKTEFGSTDIRSAPPWLVPAHMKLDYDIFYLQVIGMTREMVECEVNTISGETRFFDRRAGQVIPWADFLLGVHAVEWPDDQPGIVRIKPLAHASAVLAEYSFMHPVMIRGEWLQVELMNNDYEITGMGWIRWTDGQKLLVTYSLLS